MSYTVHSLFPQHFLDAVHGTLSKLKFLLSMFEQLDNSNVLLDGVSSFAMYQVVGFHYIYALETCLNRCTHVPLLLPKLVAKIVHVLDFSEAQIVVG